MELCGKPDFEQAMQRVEAWFNHDLLDRPPVRFAEHNAFVARRDAAKRVWPNLKAQWFDAEFQVEHFLESIKGRTFHGETFPVFWPNLGPNFYAACHGAELEYGAVTSWVKHCVADPADIAKLKFSPDNEYYRGIEALTRAALEQCTGRFMVGYTDLHGSLDCVADWRDPQNLCLDLVDNPDLIHAMLRVANENFLPVFDHYDELLKAHGQFSVTWLGIPSRGKMHVPSCDFTSLTSHEMFCEFYLPSLLREVKHMSHIVFHLDGKGMLKHLDRILNVPEIHAIQWVQGVGSDLPILQWVEVIRKIQAAGKGVVVDIQLDELDPFMAAVRPDGLFLCLAANERDQPDILRRLLRWK